MKSENILLNSNQLPRTSTIFHYNLFLNLFPSFEHNLVGFALVETISMTVHPIVQFHSWWSDYSKLLKENRSEQKEFQSSQ